MQVVRFMTLNPGHFHAALVQKEMYPGVDPRVHVYAPLDADLAAHLGRIAAFNTRPQDPTRWQLEVHAGPDSLPRMLEERPGTVLVLAGRNCKKIEAIEAAVAAGINVLADKPWIIAAADLPRLETVLNQADDRGLTVYDIMTERFEITSILQKELVNDRDIFGSIEPGGAATPGISMVSVHYIKKNVAGTPLKRPVWFFDIETQGEGLSDVGTHLVDLAPWMLYPEQPIDFRKDIELLSAARWPTLLTGAEFTQVSGEREFPPFLHGHVKDDCLQFYCNTKILYRLRGVHIEFDISWRYEAEPGSGDSHFASFRGTAAAVEIRQGKEENFIPELFVKPRTASARANLPHKVAALATRYPGLGLEQRTDEFRIIIPTKYRVGHEAHFSAVARQFLKYLARTESLPAWEKPNMLAKYFVTTNGVQLSRTL